LRDLPLYIAKQREGGRGVILVTKRFTDRFYGDQYPPHLEFLRGYSPGIYEVDEENRIINVVDRD
jgi:hypothetical protein